MDAGTVIADKYKIVRRLGAGAMGEVWQAQNLATEREFAIKVLLPEAARNAGNVQRFLQEAKVSGRLRHPSILEIFDVGRAESGETFLVMELLDGATLDAVIRRFGRLPIHVAVEIIAEIARALALAHEKGIVHRDLKPANIFLHRPGTGAVVPKVLDFGISKMSDGAPGLGISLTQTGMVLGSPLYMSPEQMAEAKHIDGRSDIHALGAVLWECIAGAPAFVATTYNNLVVEIMKTPRRHLRDVVDEVPASLDAIIHRAMSIEPGDRFARASELADALDKELSALQGGSLGSRTAATTLFASGTVAGREPAPRLQTTTSGTAKDVPIVTRTEVLAPRPRESAPALPITGPAAPAAVPAAAVTAASGRSRSVVVVGLGIAAVLGVVITVAVTMGGPKPPATATSAPAIAEPAPNSAPAPAPTPTPVSSVVVAEPAVAASTPASVVPPVVSTPMVASKPAAAPRPRPSAVASTARPGATSSVIDTSGL